MNSTEQLLSRLIKGEVSAIARCISHVENESPGHEDILRNLSFSKKAPIVGITGPPGAGKSSLISALITQLTAQNKKVAVIAVDPTSPFSFGSLLGDRVRMSEHFNNPNVYIRSLATRGSLGGLNAKIIEIMDVVKAADFDFIIVETVGVGQSEVEIAGLADTTVLVLVPEAGDEVQTIKSGIMEIADIYVINKSDREGADHFVKNLHHLLQQHRAPHWKADVIKTVAIKQEGVEELLKAIHKHADQLTKNTERKAFLLTEKTVRLIQHLKMRNIDKRKINALILKRLEEKDFNLYLFVDEILADE